MYRQPCENASMESPKLDENQQKAVEHFHGPALVVAGPGSGKTTVIKERILNLIRKHNVDPEHILAIAFTNAAADEMIERFLNEPVSNYGEPKICTLHVLGKDLITNHYKQAGFPQKPNNIWDEKKIEQIINREKSRLNRENEDKPVAIYKFEGRITGRCYIGQTRNPKRREAEHRNDRSKSNRWLHDALQKGEEQFDFTYEWVPGIEADREEAYRINSYRRRAAVNLNKGQKEIEEENSDTPITVYKIKPPTIVTCYFGMTTDSKSLDKPEGFEVIGEESTWIEASRRIGQEMEKYREWAVFNREDPLQARDSTRRRIEVFCEYFNVSYDEVLEHTQKFGHHMRRFNGMKEGIIKEKQQVNSGSFESDKIADPVIRAFAQKYEEMKTKAKAIDFLDMLIRSANMLEKNHGLLSEHQDRYRYVFVDEFQDISPVDFRLIDLFSNNLFAVGDDDQAIYGFRGGDSEIMQKTFGNRENVKKYEITHNYRSTSTIVRHAKALIENNPDRIPKNLRADDSTESQVEVLKTPRGTVKEDLLEELSKLLTTDFKKVGILARNWRGEINTIQELLDDSELEAQGFEIDWEELDDPWEESNDPDEKNRRKMFLRQGTKEIEIINIHTAKGREWDKVILLVNTMYDSLPDRRNNPTEERRLFYVAITRAKQELVILNGGNCQFIPEFQNVPPRQAELAARRPKSKVELEEIPKVARKQYEDRRGMEHLQDDTTKTKKASKNAELRLKTKMRTEPKFTADRRFNLDAINFDYLTHETGVDTDTLSLIFEKLNNNEDPDDIAQNLNIKRDIIYDLNDGVYNVYL